MSGSSSQDTPVRERSGHDAPMTNAERVFEPDQDHVSQPDRISETKQRPISPVTRKHDSWLTRPPKQPDNRHSVSSFMSQASYNPSEIGQAVPVPVQEQRGGSGEVKQMYVTRDDGSTADDDESLFSETQAQLGRLDTIKRHSQTDIQPEVTVKTELKATVPPRSRRRPVSEITPRGQTATEFMKTHRPRASLNISDDLDKLMQSARNLKSEDTPGSEDSLSLHSPISTTSGRLAADGPGSVKQLSSSASIEHFSSGVSNTSSGAKGRVHHMNFSTDSFETAEELSRSVSAESNGSSRFILPKRPTADNMRKARQASANHAQQVGALHESGASGSRNSSVKSRPTSQKSNSISSMSADPNQSNQTLEADKAYAAPRDSEAASGLDSTSSRYVSSDGESSRHTRSSLKHEPYSHEFLSHELLQDQQSQDEALQNKASQNEALQNKSLQNKALQDEPSQHETSLDVDKSLQRNFEKNVPEELEVSGQPQQRECTPMMGLEAENVDLPGHGSLDDVKSNDLEIGSTESIGADLRSDSEQFSVPKHDTEVLPVQENDSTGHASGIAKEGLLKKQLSIERQEITEKVQDDDDFSDIEEPVLSSATVKPKSVKGSMRKSTKRKSKHIKTREASGGRLKPFSYNTLVHLLESINGSVIGEEFESLNLPMREKQLIEKIVDSLSRLTSDMVIDENRYEVGIDRLERAHRVLEGFL